MKKQLLGLALTALWMGSGSVWAQVPVTPAAPTTTAAPATMPAAPLAGAKRAKQVQGRVTAVDLTKKTITVTGRKNATPTTLTLSSDAKVLVTHPATVGDIKTGDIVAAYGMDVTQGATTVSATRLVIMPSDTKLGKPGPKAGYRRNSVQGTVANTTPALTMTTPGGVTVTVTPAAGAPVTKLSAGTLSDIAVGTNIQARTTGDADSPTATQISIVPAGGERRAGAGRRRRTTPLTPAAPVTPEAPAAPAAPANP